MRAHKQGLFHGRSPQTGNRDADSSASFVFVSCRGPPRLFLPRQILSFSGHQPKAVELNHSSTQACDSDNGCDCNCAYPGTTPVSDVSLSQYPAPDRMNDVHGSAMFHSVLRLNQLPACFWDSELQQSTS